MTSKHRTLCFACVMGLVAYNECIPESRLEAPERFSYREPLRFESEYCDSIRVSLSRIAKNESDPDEFASSVGVLVGDISGPMRIAYAEFRAGTHASERSIELASTDRVEAEAWGKVAATLLESAIIRAEIASSELEVLASQALLDLGRTQRTLRDPSALSTYRHASRGEERLRGTWRFTMHWTALKRLQEIRDDALVYIVARTPEKELGGVAIPPSRYGWMLRRVPERADKAIVVDGISHQITESTLRRLDVVASDDSMGAKERETLEEAARLVTRWEASLSEKARARALK